LPQQYDIVENLNPRTRRSYPFLVVLQSDRVSSFGSVIVAPLQLSVGAFDRSRIHPRAVLGGARYVALCERLAAVESATLGAVIGSAADSRYEITAAIDMLFTGI
jgi:hypothetical protein